MRILRRCAATGAGVVTILSASLVAGPPSASADCTETDGITMCQNVIRTADTGPVEQELWYPYPCEDDYLCNDGVSVVFDYDNDNDNVRPPDSGDRPDRPDFGRPGRPGNRPGGGGGIGGGR
ncbi:hypothetical protein [Mycobacterium sp. GA-2829]|uniref:hypothetical protein n=1 Tax=Mycobacterium sp. GA-2829 TaxID=1772283 RepID=UPI00073FD6C0|nr:hypothetical protein [Mycobacterium sp. GA-2829]KUI32708.1 hypothetical protein AU194_25580 [Mycobacterium sp. GA-2829]